ncbi:MAG: hypothetical protein JKY51_06865 [Opitutaceae bacterium]|nr:hypothetical protein [Opitutaceae bacterium]
MYSDQTSSIGFGPAVLTACLVFAMAYSLTGSTSLVRIRPRRRELLETGEKLTNCPARFIGAERGGDRMSCAVHNIYVSGTLSSGIGCRNL